MVSMQINKYTYRIILEAFQFLACRERLSETVEYWDQITQGDCAMDTTRITYNVTVTRPEGEHEGVIVMSVMSGETSAVVSNLTSDQELSLIHI